MRKGYQWADVETGVGPAGEKIRADVRRAVKAHHVVPVKSPLGKKLYNGIKGKHPNPKNSRSSGEHEWPNFPADQVLRESLHKALEANSQTIKRRDLVTSALADIRDPNTAELVAIGQYFCRLSAKAAAQRNDMATIAEWFIARDLPSMNEDVHSCVRMKADEMLVEV